MKKKFLSLLILPAILVGTVSCGNSATAETDLPNAGTAVEATEGKEALKSALSKSLVSGDNSGAFAVEMTGGYLDAVLSSNTTYAGETMALNAEAHVSNATFKLAAAGLTSSSVNDLKASAKVSAGLNAKASIPTGTSENSTTELSKNISAEAYLQNAVVYAKASDDLLSLVSSLGLTIDQSSVKTALPITADMLPLISEESFESALAGIDSSLESFFETTGGVWLSHGDNTYSFSFSFAGESLKSLVSTALSDSDSTVASYAEAFKGLLEKIDDSDFIKASAIFDKENGLKSIGFNANIDLALSTSQSVGDVTYTSSASLTFKAGFKFNFSYGSAVSVDSVTNADQYEELPTK
jgi:hypothetical protein